MFHRRALRNRPRVIIEEKEITVGRIEQDRSSVDAEEKEEVKENAQDDGENRRRRKKKGHEVELRPFKFR